MDPILLACVAVLIGVIIYFVNQGKEIKERRVRQRPVQVANDGPVGRRNVRRRQGIRDRMQQQQAEEEAENSDEENDEVQAKKQGKIGAKKLRKMQEKEEKRIAREQEVREREERKKEQEERDERSRKVRELEEEEEKRQEMEEERLRKLKEQKEEEEYQKLMKDFVVDEEGVEEIDEDEEENLLGEFIDYIKTTKVIFIEELASHFGLKVQDTIDRVQTLLGDGTITGVIDDRGKLIYISMEELQSVADFINRKGRISISDLAKAANNLINLQKDETVVN